ncbi:MAG: hypothetical protein WCO22_10555 [Betaproteobacteria bacterium]
MTTTPVKKYYTSMYLNFDVGNVSKSFSSRKSVFDDSSSFKDGKSRFDVSVVFTSSLVVDIGTRLILANDEFYEKNKDTVGHSKGKRKPVTYALQVNKSKEDLKSYIEIDDNKSTKSGHLTISIDLNEQQFLEFENSLSNSLSLDSVFLLIKNHDFLKTTSTFDHRMSWDCDFIKNHILDIDYYNFTFNYKKNKDSEESQKIVLKSEKSMTVDDSNKPAMISQPLDITNDIKLPSDFTDSNNKILRYIFVVTCAIFLIILFK